MSQLLNVAIIKSQLKINSIKNKGKNIQNLPLLCMPLLIPVRIVSVWWKHWVSLDSRTLFPTLHSGVAPWHLEVSHSGTIYTRDTGKGYATGLFLSREPVVKHLLANHCPIPIPPHHRHQTFKSSDWKNTSISFNGPQTYFRLGKTMLSNTRLVPDTRESRHGLVVVFSL